MLPLRENEEIWSGLFARKAVDHCAMGDPLILLKRHGKSAVLEGDKIVFTEPSRLEIPRSTKTRFRKKKSVSDHYSLDALWFCLKSSSLSLAEYEHCPQISPLWPPVKQVKNWRARDTRCAPTLSFSCFMGQPPVNTLVLLT